MVVLFSLLFAQNDSDLAASMDLLLVGNWTTPSYAEDVTVEGNFAYLADYTAGLQIIDISNPANPRKVGVNKTGGATWSVAVSGQYAYVADNYTGLNVIDVSNPAEPRQVGAWTNSGCRMVRVFGNYAYVKAANPQDGAFKIINITNPANLTTVNWTNAFYNPTDVAISGNYAYLSDLYQGLVVFDVTDPTNPKPLGAYDTNTNAPSTTGVAVSGSFAYVTDNDFFGYKGRGLVLVDTSDPSNLLPVGEHATTGSADGVAVSDRYVFVISRPWTGGQGKGSVQVFDVSSATTPQLLTTYQFNGTATRVVVKDRYVFLSNGGLQIFKIITSPEFESVSLPPSGGVRLAISGVTGQSGRIQRSSDLSGWSDWQPVSFVTNLVEVVDSDTSHPTPRFYRILEP